MNASGLKPDADSQNLFSGKAKGAIGARLARDMIFVAVLPLVMFVFIGLTTSTRALEHAAKDNLQLVSSVTATRLDQMLSAGASLADAIARDDAVVELAKSQTNVVKGQTGEPPTALRAMVTRKLWSVVLANPDYAQITILSEAGIGICSTDPDDLGFDLSFRPYFQAARSGKLHVSDVLIGKTTKRPGVFLAAPIRDVPADAREVQRAAGKILGVLFIKLQGEKLWDIIDSAQQSARNDKTVANGDEARNELRSYTMLVDEHGIVLAHPDRNFIYKSLHELSSEVLTKVDSSSRFSMPTVVSLRMPQLWQAVSGANFGAELVELSSDDEKTPEQWAVGFAAMRQKPWRVLSITPRREFAKSIIELRNTLLWSTVAVTALAATVALWRAGRIVRPIHQLTAAAEKLAAGQTDSQVDIRTGDQLETLGQVFNMVGPKLRERLELQRSLAVAVEVQESLLPAGTPTVPHLDLHGASLYCDATGGDYYDFLLAKGLQDGSVLLAVADVMGHGIGSALLMAATRGALWAEIHDASNLADSLDRVNMVLSKDARHNKFVTLQLLAIDPRNGAAQWASAGHDPAIVYDPQRDEFFELEGCGVPLGVMEDFAYEEFKLPQPLPQRAIITIGTDGIWEAMDVHNELFGKDRMKDAIRSAVKKDANATAQSISQAILDAVVAFRGSARVTDDITLIVARRV
jgi:phosphoserine phosphatase RsbU/P